MCCSFTRSIMSNTRLYVGEAEKNGKHVHVLAYQNTADSDKPNAMVLPFPTEVAMGPDNVIDTSQFKNFLEDIGEASRMLADSRGRRSLTLGAAGFADSIAQVFDSGSYTIILADNVDQIPEALTRVSADKRPKVSSQFLQGYGKLYSDQPIAICCWNGTIEAEPLMWWYEPRDTSTLFIPTMDAHDGKAPRVGEKVNTDHIISVGSVGPTNGHKVYYTQTIPTEVQDLLPTHVFGKALHNRLENNDTLVKVAPIHADAKDKKVAMYGVPAVSLTRGSFSVVMNGWS